MRTKNRAGGVWVVSATLLAIWSCSEAEGGGPPGGVGGEAGLEGEAGAGPSAGAGGATEEGAECPSGALSELCVPPPVTTPPSRDTCPKSQAAAELDCGNIVRYPSSCGGVSVSIETAGSAYAGTWHYDAAGMLVGARMPSEGACRVLLYGKECEQTGEEVDVCEPREWCGPAPLAEACAKSQDACPQDESDILEEGCAETPTGVTPLRIERWETQCGGVVLVQGWGTHADAWEFDAEGELVGVLKSTDVQLQCDDGGRSSRSLYGERCDLVGEEPEVVCSRDLGEGGGGGEGGQGGVGG